MKTEPEDNILAYCRWRGDLPMQLVPFCPIDNLIFCCLSYLNWNGIGEGTQVQDAITLSDAAHLWLKKPDNEQEVRVPSDRTLLEMAANSTRFGYIQLFRYMEQTNESRYQQFSAVTFLLDPDTVYVAFRGTDASLNGWREDFNLSFLPHIPSQAVACAYFEGIVSMGFSRIYLGGHSKGGNLAIYAAVHSDIPDRSVICGVYNNDGPGFPTDLNAIPQYQQLKSRIFTYVPQASVIGMLLEHTEDYQVVCSTQKGFLQHDPYSWRVVRDDWQYLQETTSASQLLDTTLHQWILGMTPKEREDLTDSIFHLLQSETNARSIYDLAGPGTLPGVLRAWNDTPADTRRFIQKMLGQLFHIMRRTASSRKNELAP